MNLQPNYDPHESVTLTVSHVVAHVTDPAVPSGRLQEEARKP